MESDAMIILTIGIIWSRFFCRENHIRQEWKQGELRREPTSVLGVGAVNSKLLLSTMIAMETTKVMAR
jgi:hypothetical protein